MARTFANYLDSLRWKFAEKGLQSTWNELKQIANSKLGAGLTAGTTLVGAIDLTAENGVGLLSVATTRSGSFGASNAGVSGSSKVLTADPAGESGGLTSDSFGTPVPARLTNRTPVNGFNS